MMKKQLAFLAATTTLSLPLLSACGDDAETGDETPATSITVTSEATETSEAASSAASTSSTTKTKELSDDVADAYETFGSLAPESLFADFESCNPNGVDNSVACSGPEVGQFQFFESDSKASSTSQLLTQLRGAKVVEDHGDHIVGWSTLGSTAIITVVDTDAGLVLQQMVSTDEVDPTQRIYDLGLASPEDSASTTDSSSSAAETSSTTNSDAEDKE